MPQTRDKSKYRMIADNFRYMIHSGELKSGSKFHTRKELCDMFHISPMTAFNVQKILQDDGLITNVPGIGFYVSCAELDQAYNSRKKLRKIRMVGSPQAIGKEAVFGSEIVNGVRSFCDANGLEFEIEFVQVLNNPAHIINTSRRLDQDEALLVLLHSELLPEIVNLLISPQVKAVTIHRSFPGKPAVLPDWGHVVTELFTFCRKHNVRKLLYAGQCSRWSFSQSESEFFEKICDKVSGFDWKYNLSGNFRNIAEDIENYQPDAVIFSHSDAAVHLKKNYFEKMAKTPLVIGFGHSVNCDQEEHLSAVYYPDGRTMGEKAAELLTLPDINIRPPLFCRVGGHFKELI